MKQETVAEQIARLLLQSGVDTVFGLPGGENLVFLEALRRAGLAFVLTRHESSAVFMASASARLTRRVSACLTTLGPGAVNAVAGIAHAYLDRCPVLVFTAQLADSQLDYHTHQALDLGRLFAPITKGSFKLRPGEDGQTLSQAMELATGGRPGPVHLQLSADAASSLTTYWPELQPTITKPGPSVEQAGRAKQLLSKARRPVIVAGLGLEPEGPYDAIVRCAEAWGAPVVTTAIAKGSISEDHPLAAGVIGLTASDPAYRLIDEADYVLALGFDVVELVKPWRQAAPLIWVASWPNTQPVLPAVAELVGSIEACLRLLTGVDVSPDPDWSSRRVLAMRRANHHKGAPESGTGRMPPRSVIEAVRASSPRETIAVSDVGAHKILAALEWPSYVPNSYLVSNGLSSMGFGLPAAIAASRLYPRRPVICFTGDGGMAMALGELSLVADQAVSLIIVVFNDGALELIRAKQRQAGFKVYGTTFNNPDWSAVGRAYGIRYFLANNGTECAAATLSAIDGQAPALIEARIDPAEYPTWGAQTTQVL